MTLTVAPLYAGLAAFMLVALSLRVVRMRRSKSVSVGDAGDRLLLRAMRAQSNFIEYAPFTVVLMALAELQGTSPWLLHAVGVVLLAGRVMHAFGLSVEPDNFPLRLRGMYLTVTALTVSAITCIVQSVLGLVRVL